MELFDKLREIAVRPAEFFGEIKHEEGTLPALGFAAILVAFQALMFGLMYLVIGLLVEPSETVEFVSSGFGVVAIIIGLAVYVAVMIIVTYLMCGILHLFVRLFSGDGDFPDTFKMLVYAHAPILILGWIPIINLAALFWTIVLMVIAGSEIHGFSRDKSFGVNLLAYATFNLVVFLAYVVIFVLLFTSRLGAFA